MKHSKQKVVIYIKQGCLHCKSAKKLLEKKGVQYEEIDVVKNPDLFSEIKSEYNVKTVPQIFINEKHIGGNDKLQKLNNEGKLDDMLSSDVTPYKNDDDNSESSANIISDTNNNEKKSDNMLHDKSSTNAISDENNNTECGQYTIHNNGDDFMF